MPPRKSSTGSSDGKKQTTLSSFFKKASATPKPAKVRPGSEVVGKRLKVWWPADGAWYAGRVASLTAGGATHEVRYDDGDVEAVDLAVEKYEWLADEESPSAVASTQAYDGGKRAPAAAGGSAAKRAKRAASDDDDDDDAMDDGDDGDDGSDYDGGGGEGDADSADDDSDDDSEEEAPKPKARKRRIVVESDDDDDGDAAAPPKKKAPCRISTDVATRGSAAFDASAFHDKYRKRSGGSEASAPVSAEKARSADDDDEPLVNHDAGDDKARSVFPAGCHLHDTDPGYAFAGSDRRDAAGLRPGDAGFDCRTLKVPKDCAVYRGKGLSEVQRQWWAVKSTHFDCLLFFKIGKFYEMYHMDADVGVRDGGLVYMKGEQAHSGFPELAYGKYVEALVAKGHKVARVEQTETPDGTKLRVERLKKTGRKPSSAEKTMRREVCSVVTPGTRTYSVLDMRLEKDGGGFEPVAGPTLLAAVREREVDGVLTYGVCVCDAPTGTFTLAQFEDDAMRTRLRTLLADKACAEVLVERAAAASNLVDVVRRSTTAAVESLAPGAEFWGAEKTVDELDASGTFPKASKAGPAKGAARAARWPAVLQKSVEGGADLAVSALGAVAWWLRRGLVDVELLSMRRFESYCPADGEVEADEPLVFVPCDRAALEAAAAKLRGLDGDDDRDAALRRAAPRMALDATTLKNLEVLGSAAADGRAGSLWQLVDHCKTPFGRRLLREWLARPLVDARDVADRTDAVAELVEDRGLADSLRSKLARIPDLERLLQQLHTLGAARRAVAAGDDDDLAQHPDARAVLFDAKKFDARKVKQLADALQALGRCAALAEGADVAAPLLAACLGPSGAGGCFPDLDAKLAAFDSFDLAEAKRTGELAAVRGVDDAYDAALDDKAARVRDLDDWLKEAKREHRCPDLKYKTSAKDRYCVEVPEQFFARGRAFEHLPAGWTQRTKTKKCRSFLAPDVAELVEALEDAEKRAAAAKVDQMRSLFAAFDKERDRWAAAVACVGTLDALLALAHVSRRPGFSRAVLEDGAEPFVAIDDGAHPCLAGDGASAGDVIANDVHVGGAKPRMLLLSGPNMGGKSTLLRHVCVSAILAQAGCFVKARAMRLSPVDRVFTRLGASDRILMGQSTFMVELLETAAILKQASAKSLVILDELGRGTATWDGAAIAHSVVHHLVAHSKCRALFATHYHDLVASWAGHADVQLGHMDCLVDPESDTVVFLYKLTDGCSPKSFGINVAKLAKLPKKVLDRAAAKSAEFEAKLKAKSQAKE